MAIRSRKAFTLVEIMIVVAILGIISAIAIPSFFRARELSRMRACQENLQKVDGAKQQWAIEKNKKGDSSVDWSDLIGRGKYINAKPTCSSGGTYTLSLISEYPICSFSSQAEFPHVVEAAPPGNQGGGT